MRNEKIENTYSKKRQTVINQNAGWLWCYTLVGYTVWRGTEGSGVHRHICCTVNLKFCDTLSQKDEIETGKMAPWFKAFAALAEYLGSVASTRVVAHSSLEL